MDIQLNFDEEQASTKSIEEKVEVVKEKEKCFIISMNSKFRIRWDLWIIITVMYNALETPLELAFEQDFTSLGIVLFGYIIDLFFITDMVINFRTTFIN